MKFINKYESFSIRGEYEKSSPQEYYSNNKNEYYNPHSKKIFKCLDYLISEINIGYFLDLGCGNGIVSEYLLNKSYNNFKGCDPYFKDIYENKFHKDCFDKSFEDISKKGLDDKFDTIICSYALHLCEPTYFNNLLYQLSNSCKKFTVISPSKYPIISNDYFELDSKSIFDRAHIRIYNSKINI